MRILLALVALTACSSPTLAPRDCTPGQTAACDCPGGASSIQVCGTDGRLGACMCPDGGTRPDTAVPDGGSCRAPQTLCGLECVNTLSDALHCGGCNASCSGLEECRGAMCVPRAAACAAPRLICGAACVDPQTDNVNCGGCGRACGTETRCVAGSCVAGTDGGVLDAPTGCVDRDRDTFGAGCAAGPDCDDNNPLRNPAAVERCNGVDDNCNGTDDVMDRVATNAFCLSNQNNWFSGGTFEGNAECVALREAPTVEGYRGVSAACQRCFTRPNGTMSCACRIDDFASWTCSR